MQPTATIDDIVQAMQQLVATPWAAMEQVMIDQLRSADVRQLPLLTDIANHLLSAGGKRLRPLLCLMADQLLLADKNSKPLPLVAGVNPMVYLASAVEFIHGATLLHDDVIDASALRRGKKTANHIWGNHLPVLVGDFLFARAFQLMVKVDNQAVLTTLAQTAATLSMGEVWQLSHQLHYQQQFLTMADYEKIIFAKTGSLFSASLVVAGLLRHNAPKNGGANGEENGGAKNHGQAVNDALYELGKAIGMIFQLVDDGLDYFGDPAKTKKSIGTDFFEGKITLPILLLYERAAGDRAVIERLNGYFLGAPPAVESASPPAAEQEERTNDDLSWVVGQLRHYDIASAVNNHIDQFVARALTHLAPFADSPAKQLMTAFVKASHQRQG